MLNGSQANSPFTILVLLLPLTSSFFNSKPSKGILVAFFILIAYALELMGVGAKRCGLEVLGLSIMLSDCNLVKFDGSVWQTSVKDISFPQMNLDLICEGYFVSIVC